MRSQGLQRDERYPVESAGRAWVEFCYPQHGGRALSCRLIDVSVAGISFLLEEDLPLMARGARIADARITVGDKTLRGSLVIKHLTEIRRGELICGAVLYPSTETDMNQLAALIESLTARVG